MGFYRNSKGELLDIDQMPYKYLKNAYAKAMREGDPQSVGAEMSSRLAELEEAYRLEHPEEFE